MKTNKNAHSHSTAVSFYSSQHTGVSFFSMTNDLELILRKYNVPACSRVPVLLESVSNTLSMLVRSLKQAASVEWQSDADGMMKQFTIKKMAY